MAEARSFDRISLDRRGLLLASLGAGLALTWPRPLVFARENGATDGLLAAPDGAAAWPLFNLNAASAEQFMGIPGAGERMTREFEEYRPYTSIGQFRAELGKYIAPEEVAAFERYLFVPVAASAADAETLQQLPGVSAEVAGALAAEGPFDSPEALLAALETAISPDLVAAAKAYVAGA